MAKIALSKLKLNKETQISKLTIGEAEIEVKNYLPLEEKISAINIVIQEAAETSMINRAKADALIHMYMIMLYTNISFTKKEKENLFELYDLFEKNGAIDEITSIIPEIEYDAFIDYATQAMDDFDKYKTSVVGVVEQILNDVPATLETLNIAMSSFDANKLNLVADITRALGGDQDVLTNEFLGQE